ncbi:iron ABC transporter permease [Bacillus sp. V2I10]|uniref:FecCD family ABC transporter permease n=1 Tax=Bacillus sp. V2I10 TaxID=3042276 RepID=UPI002783AED5|nr:iron ABC transporter permease [Bacillus sp. V2I10]MDQ0859935.1 iron complex transport system permease protein [Bacillus sp. V2I10]
MAQPSKRMMDLPRKVLWILLSLFLVSSSLFVVSLSIGEPFISLHDIYMNLVHHHPMDKIQHLVSYEIRMPRAVIAVMAGIMLALTGSLLQDAFQNDLAGPELIGVSGGVSFMIAILTVFHLSVPFSMYPLVGMVGGVISGTVVIISAKGRMDKGSFILIGTAISAFLNSLVIIVITLGRQNDISLLFFYLTGSLAGRNWSHVQNLLPWFLIFVPIALLCSRILNVMKLGDDAAKGRGVPVVNMRVFLLLIGVGLIASVVANCGPIGFISLLAPHITKKLLNSENAYFVLPVSALIGGVLLLSADFLLRVIFYPYEMPVGLLTTIIGGITLLFFLRQRRRTV